MLTCKQKFLNEISNLPEAQVKKFYFLFHLLIKEFVTENNGTGD